jgi:N-acetylglutamate synthase-like GNAT family acetyltransferase
VTVIRPAGDDDLTRVSELVADAYLADDLVPRDHWYVDELRAAAHRALHAELIVAEDEGTVVGTVTLASAGSPYAEIARAGEIEIRMLAVAPAARGRGVGEALVRAALERAWSTGAEAVVLTTLTPMLAAQRVYERIGFTRDPARDWAGESQTMLVYTAHPATAG